MFLCSFSKLRYLGSCIAFAFSFSVFFMVNSTTLQTSSSIECSDPYEDLHLILNPNGTITRLYDPPRIPPSHDPTLPVLSKDLTINQSKGTWARIFLPREALDQNSKLPLVVYFHGGGFIFESAASNNFHQLCFNMANDVRVVAASIDYRLAPEHRLPAAYEDAVEALHWIKTNQADDWLRNYVDYSSVFLMGHSAGGNIAYNTGLLVAAGDEAQDEGFHIRGMILAQPFFGGVRRTESELRLKYDSHLSLCDTDSMWKLALPIGANRDHEYANPTKGEGPARLEKIRQLGWKALVTGCSGDLLVDRQIELVRLMQNKGVKVVGHFTQGGYHGDDVEPFYANKLYELIKSFISDVPAQVCEELSFHQNYEM